MLQLVKVTEMQQMVSQLRNSSKSIGLVPTMGALHSGHLELIRQSKQKSDFTVCSVFVNPRQFNDAKDLKAYPKQLDKDIALLEQQGCDLLFVPEVDDVYPQTYTPVKYDIGSVGTVLEGKHRPAHFEGVVEVVSRLFSIVMPDFAFFGLKDYQQFLIVKKMAMDLFPEIQVEPVPTVREKSGLAKSSRNLRLDESQLAEATAFYKALCWIKEHLQDHSLEELKQLAVQKFLSQPKIELEYLEICDRDSLQKVSENKSLPLIALLAGKIGEVRLIDNMFLDT